MRLTRKSMIRRLAIVCGVVGGVVAAAPATASAADSNLLANGGFESGDTSGWVKLNSDASVVTPAFAGAWAGKAVGNGAASYGLRQAVRPVRDGVAGTQFAAGGMVRSDAPGEKICIYLTEYTPAGRQLGQSKACTTTTVSWAPLNTVTRSLVGSGGTMAFAVRQSAAVTGDSFEVDELSLVAEPLQAASTVALWHMDELGGPMLDSGAPPADNGYQHGRVKRGVPGLSGTAYSFTRGWFTVPSRAPLNPGTAAITIRASLNPASLPSSGDFDIIRKGDYPAQLYKMELLRSGAVFCQFRGSGGAASVTSTNALAPNTGWHTATCLRSGSGIQVVLDGVVTSRNANVGSISNTAPVVIGAHTGGSGGFYKGAMDEVSITVGS